MQQLSIPRVPPSLSRDHEREGLVFPPAFFVVFLADLAGAFLTAAFEARFLAVLTGTAARDDGAECEAAVAGAAPALLRAVRVFSASAAFSSWSNCSGLKGRADLRRRSMS